MTSPLLRLLLPGEPPRRPMNLNGSHNLNGLHNLNGSHDLNCSHDINGSHNPRSTAGSRCRPTASRTSSPGWSATRTCRCARTRRGQRPGCRPGLVPSSGEQRSQSTAMNRRPCNIRTHPETTRNHHWRCMDETETTLKPENKTDTAG
jgi:hypothetical protein